MSAHDRRKDKRQRTAIREADRDRDAMAGRLAEVVAERAELVRTARLETIKIDRLLAEQVRADVRDLEQLERRRVLEADLERLELELEQVRAQLAPLEADNKKLRRRLRNRERAEQSAGDNRKAAGF